MQKGKTLIIDLLKKIVYFLQVVMMQIYELRLLIAGKILKLAKPILYIKFLILLVKP